MVSALNGSAHRGSIDSVAKKMPYTIAPHKNMAAAV